MDSLEKFSTITKKGKIVRYISSEEEFERLVCNLLSPDVRNAIGHYSYEGEEVANGRGQIIRFVDIKDKNKFTEKTLIEICYDIWQMYKCLAVFYELIYRIEMVNLNREGIQTTSLRRLDTGVNLKSKTIVKPMKIYPNELCPCGSRKKYKKCCGKKF
ncbi:MAG: SEC-C domain-containing protein [Lachnospiraceae bacterium]|nr:SEC-C domain-containing protein [Lachnospiraceae bacterium]